MPTAQLNTWNGSSLTFSFHHSSVKVFTRILARMMQGEPNYPQTIIVKQESLLMLSVMKVQMKDIAKDANTKLVCNQTAHFHGSTQGFPTSSQTMIEFGGQKLILGSALPSKWPQFSCEQIQGLHRIFSSSKLDHNLKTRVFWEMEVCDRRASSRSVLKALVSNSKSKVESRTDSFS